MEKVLIVDEDPIFRDFIIKTLSEKGIHVTSAENGIQALAVAKSEPLDLIIADCMLLDLKKIQKVISKETEVIFTSAKERETPSKLLEDMLLRAKRPKGVIAESPVMQEILKEAIRIAKSSASVFISGESGTGKEVIAQVIHSHSQRSDGPFVKVNCAAIPENLVESEFFGHEKGAFTGANGQKPGRFEIAHQGTLLLDEVTEIPLSLQAKLLRALQEREFERVGGTKSIKVNVRIVSTSNRNALEAVRDKIFREDLYYRLNVVPIHLPPLREHPEDIIPLAEHFLERACRENKVGNKALSDAAKEKLLQYGWPGNVRELANLMERMAVTVEEELLEGAHFVLEKKELTLEDVEKKHILNTVKERGDEKLAAKALGITVKKLQTKLKEYNDN